MEGDGDGRTVANMRTLQIQRQEETLAQDSHRHLNDSPQLHDNSELFSFHQRSDERSRRNALVIFSTFTIWRGGFGKAGCDGSVGRVFLSLFLHHMDGVIKFEARSWTGMRTFC